MFDNYTLKARYYPVIILFFPIIVLGLFYSFQFDSTIHAFASVSAASALTYLFSQLGRDQGKLKEPALWKSWGGSPSIQIFRLRNEHLDKHTKQRYHQRLLSLCPVDVIPDLEMETNNPNSADEVYKAWSKYLISQTRDTKKYALLFKDNISYGFRRNLWGLKPFAVFIILGLVIGNYLFWVFRMDQWIPVEFPLSFMYSTIALLLLLCFWLFIVTKNWVRIPAFSYAERLCESVEII